MTRSTLTSSLFLWILLLSIPGLAAASYTVMDLGTLGGVGTQALGINGSGQIAGESATATGQTHAFLYGGGQMSDLNPHGSSFSLASAINPSGQACGYYYTTSYQAFRWTAGKIRDLGTLGGEYAAAYAINSGGDVCGSSYTKANREHAFLWTGRRMTDLGTLGGEYSTARGINASDQVVGYAYLPNGGYHAFLYGGGAMRDLGTMGGDYSSASAINDAGQIVGQAAGPGNTKIHAFLLSGAGQMQDLGDLGGNISEAAALNSTGTVVVGKAVVPSNTGFVVYHAFVWSGGGMQDLNNLISASGWMLQEARGVNDAGQIVGIGILNGEVRGFLLNPAGAASVVETRASENTLSERAIPHMSAATSGGVPSTLTISRVSPNPAHSGTELAYAVPSEAAVTLTIFDVRGRIVRRITLQGQSPGRHSVPWDLKDDAGRPVGSGIYFMRLEEGLEAHTARVIVAR